MKTWVKSVLLAAGVLVLGLGMLAAFGGWLPMFLAGVSVVLFMSLALAWDSIRIYAADHKPWWTYWAALPTNMFVVITRANGIVEYVASPTDPGMIAAWEKLREQLKPLRIKVTILKPNQGLVHVGFPFVYKLKEWAWSKFEKYYAGVKAHAIPLGPVELPIHAVSDEDFNRALAIAVKAKEEGRILPPSEIQDLMRVSFMLSRDGIELAIPLKLYLTIINGHLFCTQGMTGDEFPLDKILGAINNSLFLCVRQLDFLVSDDKDSKSVNTEFVNQLQHKLNVHFGIEKDDLVLPGGDSPLIQLISRIGVRIDGVALSDTNETSGEVTNAMRQRALASTKRDADLVAADAQAKIDIRKAEGTKQASVTIAEGKKQSDILNAEARKQTEILEAEGKKQATILEGEGQFEAAKSIAKGDRERIIAWSTDEGQVTESAGDKHLAQIQAEAYRDAVGQPGAGKTVVVGAPGSSADPIAGAAAALARVVSGVSDTPTAKPAKKGMAGETEAKADEETPPSAR